MHQRILGTLAVCVLAISASLFVASPAQAVTGEIKRGSKCMYLITFSVRSNLKLGLCGRVGTAKRQGAGTYGGHPAIFVRWQTSQGYWCIDSAAQTSGNVRIKDCNGGSYQKLEVFNGSVQGTKVLKSVGAYEEQGVHRCISVSNTAGAKMKWATCDIWSTAQHFKFV